jgi:hypothetical protein
MPNVLEGSSTQAPAEETFRTVQSIFRPLSLIAIRPDLRTRERGHLRRSFIMDLHAMLLPGLP